MAAAKTRQKLTVIVLSMLKAENLCTRFSANAIVHRAVEVVFNSADLLDSKCSKSDLTAITVAFKREISYCLLELIVAGVVDTRHSLYGTNQRLTAYYGLTNTTKTTQLLTVLRKELYSNDGLNTNSLSRLTTEILVHAATELLNLNLDVEYELHACSVLNQTASKE